MSILINCKLLIIIIIQYSRKQYYLNVSGNDVYINHVLFLTNNTYLLFVRNNVVCNYYNNIFKFHLRNQ